MNIKVNVRDKRAAVEGAPVIVCGNSDYTITFTFDSEWSGYEFKTARFAYTQKGKVLHTDVVFTNDFVSVPLLTNVKSVFVGVYAGDLRTTTPARIPCELSIRCSTGAPFDPTPSQYDQIMELLRSGIVGVTEQQLNEAVEELNDDIKANAEKIDTLQKQMADVLYDPIAISSFTNNVNTAEVGSVVTVVSLSWLLNKTPTSLTLDAAPLSPELTGTTLSDVSISDKKTFTLKATDERGATATKTTAINFYNRIRYGAAAAYTELALSGGVLSDTKKREFTVTPGEGQYIWYILPKRLGTCNFNAGGFDGGFTLFKTEQLTNASGYAEDYYVYRSDNAALGETKVVVS